jgi:hypothetical protein
MKSAHGPLAQKPLCAPGRETARSRKRPAAHSSSDRAPPARKPCGPRRKTVHRPARAQRVPRSRPQPGPGPRKSLPAWAESRSGDCEPFISIQRLREVSGQTKPRSGSIAQTLASFLSSAPSRAPQRATPSDRRAAPERACPRRRLEPLTGVRAHRWVNAPPSSGLSGASLRSLAPTRRRATAPSRSRRQRRSRRGAPARSWARPHADERWSSSTRAARRSTTRGSAADGDCEETQVRPKPTYSSL